MVINAGEDHDVKVVNPDLLDIVNGNVGNILHARLQRRPSDREGRVFREGSLAYEVGGINLRCPASLGLERVEPVPAADIEHLLAAKIEIGKRLLLMLVERPLTGRDKTAAEIDLVHPLQFGGEINKVVPGP